MMRHCLLLWIGFAVSAFAQEGRESYRGLYQAWRQAAPTLEQDASAPGPAFAERVRVSAEAAQAFWVARAAYLATAAPDAADRASWAAKPLVAADGLLSTPRNVEQLLAVRAAKVSSDIGAFPADDKDAAIRRVRQAMERERAALRALMEALNERKGPMMELIDSTDEAESQRASVSQALTSAAARRTQLSEHVKREAADWAEYYKDLLEGATGAGRSSSSTVAPTTGLAAAPTKIIRPVSNGQIPITRFTGEWIFPNKGLFYGPPPESVELVIEGNEGGVSGTLSARFAAPAATVKFDFQGPVQPMERTQRFPLQGSDGSSGVIELIPGSAINLLEVNFQTASGSVNAGNFVLVKR